MQFPILLALVALILNAYGVWFYFWTKPKPYFWYDFLYVDLCAIIEVSNYLNWAFKFVMFLPSFLNIHYLCLGRFGNVIHLFWRSLSLPSYRQLTLLMLFFYHAYRSYKVLMCIFSQCLSYSSISLTVHLNSFFASVQYQPLQLYLLSTQTHVIFGL